MTRVNDEVEAQAVRFVLRNRVNMTDYGNIAAFEFGSEILLKMPNSVTACPNKSADECHNPTPHSGSSTCNEAKRDADNQ